MPRRSTSALVVLEDERLVGLLTERDLVRVIVDGADYRPRCRCGGGHAWTW